MQKPYQRYRVIAVIITVFGLGFLGSGLFAGFYYYTHTYSVTPAISINVYPYREYAVPLSVLGLLILLLGIVLAVWSWGRQA